MAHTGRHLPGIERLELSVKTICGADRGTAHVRRDPVVVVEDHDVDEVDTNAVRDRVLEHREPAPLEPVRVGRQGVLDLERAACAGGPRLELRDRLVSPVDPVGPGERAALDVHVEAGDVVGGHDALVRVGDAVDALARVADLGAALVRAPTTERRDDVAADRSERGEVAQVAARRERLRLRPVPCEGAGALPVVSRNASVKNCAPDAPRSARRASLVQVSKYGA